MEGILIANDTNWQKYRKQLIPLLEDYDKRAKKHCVLNDYKDWDMVEWVNNFINYPQVMMCAVWDEKTDKFVGFVVFEIVNFVENPVLFWKQTYVISKIKLTDIMEYVIKIMMPIVSYLNIKHCIILSQSKSINKVLESYGCKLNGFFYKFVI